MTPFGSFLFEIILIVVVAYSCKYCWKYAIKIEFTKSRYVCLYELYKVQEQLKERGLTFEDLDKLWKEKEDVFKKSKKNINLIKEIDEKYKKEEKKEKGAK